MQIMLTACDLPLGPMALWVPFLVGQGRLE
jgi:hypothetical protein